jgi:signal transduction histidine kinase
VVDTAWAVLALAVGLSSEQNVLYGMDGRPLVLRLVDVVLGVGCFAGIWVWLRRRPVAFALAAIAIGVVSTLAGGIALICVFTVAQRRTWRTAVVISVLAALSILPALALYPVPHADRAFAVGALATFAATGWGMYGRARSELLASLRRQLDQAKRSAADSVAAARRAERTRIAREMHDVLAHRLSLLAVHAGALEYHRDASAEEVNEIAGIIRGNTHEALEELRQVISLLREKPPDEERPQPTLADLPALVEESRSAGLAVTYVAPARAGDHPAPTSDVTGRTAYRVVQEALTNVRKHAPQARVWIEIREDAGTVEISVRNKTSRLDRAAAPPGSGTGLIGLRERVTLAGGRIEYGPLGADQFQVRAWLPHTAPDRVPS